MGILNCTPDSFSDGGKYASPDEAVRAGIEMVHAGADWIDVGGESTRPGSAPVPPDTQLDRVLPVVRGLRSEVTVPVSIDTMSPRVARKALEAGADAVNDVSACRDPEWQPLLAECDAPVVLVHMRGTPGDMQVAPDYPRGVVPEVLEFLQQRILCLSDWGVAPERILVDPGIGFGKRLKDNLLLIRNIEAFKSLGRPIFIGTSRKSFLRSILNLDMEATGSELLRLDLGTAMANCIALWEGADLIRVHNVAYADVLVKVLSALYCGEGSPGDAQPGGSYRSGGVGG